MKKAPRLNARLFAILFTLSALALGGPYGANSCSNTETASTGSSSSSGSSSSTLAFTSAAASDGFDDAGSIPTKFACRDAGGNNELPTLSWSGASDKVKSFAITMIDLTTDPDTTHMVLFDIAKSLTSVDDEDNFNDSNSAVNYNNTRSYEGPCPPLNETHTYEFTLYELDVENLVSETGASSSSSSDTIAKIKANTIASDKITGTFKSEQ